MSDKVISVVTGANGFLGSNLVDYLIERGDEVHCLVRKSSNLRWLEGKDVIIHDSGLFDLNGLSKVLNNVDYLYHVAGVVKAKNEEGYYKGNVTATENLLNTVLVGSPNIKRVLVVSSLTSCGPSLNGNIRTESMPRQPITTYGRSKAAQEELVEKYMDRIPITIVRPPAIFGERDTEIYLFFKTYMKGLMSLIGFNKKELSLIYVQDLVQGIYLAATNEVAKGEIYFISSKDFYNWPQIGKILQKVTGKKAVTLRLPHFIVYGVAAVAQLLAMPLSTAATFNLEKARDFVQESWTCDISKAEKDLGFKESYSLEEALKRTIDWYLDENWL